MKIAVYAGEGNTWGDVNPDALTRGLGGRETAAVQLARQWGALGHEVHVFAPNRGATHEEYPEEGGSTSFIDTSLIGGMLQAFPYDVVLSWEDPHVFSIPAIKQWGAITVCGMQVAHIVNGSMEEIEATDCWVALSDWHAEFLTAQLPETLQPRMSVKPNCIDLSRYKQPRAADYTYTPGQPLRFLYASSPDRGLHHLLNAWPRLRQMYPKCELHVVYGARRWANATKFTHYAAGDIAATILRKLAQPGIIDHGKVGQDTLAELHYASDFLLYPCDPILPTETGCITVVEACAAGNVPLLTSTDCLPSEFADVAYFAKAPYNEDDFLDRLDELVQQPDLVNKLRTAGREFALERGWNDVAARWIEMFEDVRQDVYPPVAAD